MSPLKYTTLPMAHPMANVVTPHSSWLVAAHASSSRVHVLHLSNPVGVEVALVLAPFLPSPSLTLALLELLLACVTSAVPSLTPPLPKTLHTFIGYCTHPSAEVGCASWHEVSVTTWLNLYGVLATILAEGMS